MQKKKKISCQSSTKLVNTPKTICEHEGITTLWTQDVRSDGEALANMLHIMIKNKADKICLFINAAMPLDRNVIKEEG
jgi:hypothetical protein